MRSGFATYNEGDIEMDQVPARVTTGIVTELRALASLRPHPRNYRRHPEHQLAILRESLRVHGQ